MSTRSLVKKLTRHLRNIAGIHVSFVKNTTLRTGKPTLVLFPFRPSTLGCGLSGIVTYHRGKIPSPRIDCQKIEQLLQSVEKFSFAICKAQNLPLAQNYLGCDSLAEFRSITRDLNSDDAFVEIFFDKDLFNTLSSIADRVGTLIKSERGALETQAGTLPPADVDILSERIEVLLDIHWSFTHENFSNISLVRELINPPIQGTPTDQSVRIFKKVNTVLNAIDRLEVRGRDSAGISLLFTFPKNEFESFRKKTGRRRSDQPAETADEQRRPVEQHHHHQRIAG
jgi:glucosamine--fructose-6-phosphate aminotransferase (isomerizing)